MTKSSTTERDEQLVEEFLRWMTVERGRAANTISNYRRDLIRYVAFLGEAKKSLLTAREGDVEEYVRLLQASGDANASNAKSEKPEKRGMNKKRKKGSNAPRICNFVKIKALQKMQYKEWLTKLCYLEPLGNHL